MIAARSLPLRIRRHHLFAERDGRRELVDTGSPWSLPAAALPHSSRERVGVDFERLIGMDELGCQPLRLDLRRGRLEFDAAARPGAAEFSVDFLGSVPRLAARVGGREFDLVLDTGAPLTYLPPEALPAEPPFGRYEDFHPRLGPPFSTGLHRVELEVGGWRFRTVAGALPGELGDLLGVFGVAGILGLPLLRRRSLWLDPAAGTGRWEMAGGSA